MLHTIDTLWLLPANEREGVTDPLLLSSGKEIYSASVDHKWDVSLRVCGDVRVTWKGSLYTDVSQFPDELKAFIRDNSNIFLADFPEDSGISMNNWYELFVYNDKSECVFDEVLDEDVASLTEESVKEDICEVIDLIFSNQWDGKENPGTDEMAKAIKEHFRKDARLYDSCIDDGSDDPDDEYVMKDCYELEGGGTIRIYYGNNTRLIGYVEIQND